MFLSSSDMWSAIRARGFDLKLAKSIEGDDELKATLAVVGRGKEVLKDHTLRFSGRSSVFYMADGTIPCHEEGHSTMREECGYIGTSQAYHTAIFNHRKK